MSLSRVHSPVPTHAVPTYLIKTSKVLPIPSLSTPLSITSSTEGCLLLGGINESPADLQPLESFIKLTVVWF